MPTYYAFYYASILGIVLIKPHLLEKSVKTTITEAYIRSYIFTTDDSGRWGKGGLFDALSARSMQPQPSYEQAGRMRDLTLGDAHLIPIDDLQSRENGRDMVCNL